MKTGFLKQIARFFKISPIDSIPCLTATFEEAISGFHDFLVDKRTGPAADLHGFRRSIGVENRCRYYQT